MAEAAVWRQLFRWRFEEEPPEEAVWPRPYGDALKTEADHEARWRLGALRQEAVLPFVSFVRSWACDEELIVAGLYSGALEAFHWESGERWQFNGRHNDEVVAVALNREFVLSGSGDPGYYGRPPRDASVRLWSRQGLALRKFDGHADSVRAVGLFKDGLLARYGLSGSLDQHLLLWTLSGTGGMECTAALPGACRCLRILAEDGRDARVLATANLSVVELAVSAQETSARVTVLKQVVCQVPGASLAVFLEAPLRESLEKRRWPRSFLEESSLQVAVGGVDGALALICGGSCRAMQRLTSEGDIISAVMPIARHILTVCRDGTLRMVRWSSLAGLEKLWGRSGWRMYVSTIGCRGACRLVSDGFDNLIRTFILEKTVESAMDWSDSEDDVQNECAESEESSED